MMKILVEADRFLPAVLVDLLFEIAVPVKQPDRDEIQDMEQFIDRLTKLVKAPLMIDSTDAAVMATALTYCQGKAILNSINLEDGLSRFDKVVPLAKQYGAALVVGTIDEKGMAVCEESGERYQLKNKSVTKH